jgi:hypothetical protein
MSADPILWLRADTGTFLDAALTMPASVDGDEVKGWRGVSPTTINATTADVTPHVPLLKTAVQAGRNVLRFSQLDLQSLALSAPITIGPAITIVSVFRRAGLGVEVVPCGRHTAGFFPQLIDVDDSIGCHFTPQGALVASGQVAGSGASVLITPYGQGVRQCLLNAAVLQWPTVPVASGTIDQIGRSGSTDFSGGDLCEVRIYDRVVGWPELGSIREALRAYWSVTATQCRTGF